MHSNVFEPMTVSRIFDATFKIYKHNFVRFLAIIAILYVPISLISIVSVSFFKSEMSAPVIEPIPSEPPEGSDEAGIESEAEYATEGSPQFAEPNPLAMTAGFVGIAIGGILTLLGHKLYQGALIKSVSEFYLGKDISVAEAYKAVLPKFLRLIGAGILIVMVIYVGLIFLVVPGVIFGLWFSLTIPIIIVENLGITAAMSRSKQLVKGNMGKVFGVGFLILLISWAISIPFGYGGTLISLLTSQDEFISFLIQNTIGAIGQILAIPIGAAAWILLYYDLRIRKEGFDLEMLAQSMEMSRT
jgi:hypothetical protein